MGVIIGNANPFVARFCRASYGGREMVSSRLAFLLFGTLSVGFGTPAPAASVQVDDAGPLPARRAGASPVIWT
jgi:hypothetical protein